LARDGRLAYTSDETGRLEVYVRHLDSNTGAVLSVGAGFDPRWGMDGRELYYMTPDGWVMAADVAPGSTLRVTGVRRLFQASTDPPSPPYLSNFIPSKDAERFLIHVRLGVPGEIPITVTLDWRGR
jgi:hypothetical protein